MESGEPVVTWMGSGDFHHVTALLVELLAKERGVSTWHLSLTHTDLVAIAYVVAH